MHRHRKRITERYKKQIQCVEKWEVKEVCEREEMSVTLSEEESWR